MTMANEYTYIHTYIFLILTEGEKAKSELVFFTAVLSSGGGTSPIIYPRQFTHRMSVKVDDISN